MKFFILGIIIGSAGAILDICFGVYDPIRRFFRKMKKESSEVN
jgi:hypothetical protein